MAPAILVFPDCFTALGGNQYINSSAIGRYADYLTREIVPFVYAGVAIFAPALFEGAPDRPFPLSLLFERAATAGRLHGLRIDGLWIHVGNPGAIAEAEAAILASAA